MTKTLIVSNQDGDEWFIPLMEVKEIVFYPDATEDEPMVIVTSDDGTRYGGSEVEIISHD